jgi:uncharacterized membrane protein
MKTILTALLLLAVLGAACRDKTSSHRAVSFKGPEVSIDVRALKEGLPEFYAASPNSKDVWFFLIKVNGEVQSYFDACLSCYERKLGFREEGGYIVCKSCNVRYPVEELRTGIGGCYPIHLKGQLQGNEYVITRENLAKGERFF